MLARSVVFLPRLRATEQRALSPRDAQACRGVSDVFEPISSTKNTRSLDIDLSSDERPPNRSQELVTFARSHCLFSGPSHATKQSANGRLTSSPATLRRYSHLSERVAAGHSRRSASKSLPCTLVCLRAPVRAPLRA